MSGQPLGVAQAAPASTIFLAIRVMNVRRPECDKRHAGSTGSPGWTMPPFSILQLSPDRLYSGK
jgi:hypothetical protein